MMNCRHSSRVQRALNCFREASPARYHRRFVGWERNSHQSTASGDSFYNRHHPLDADTEVLVDHDNFPVAHDPPVD